MNNHTCTRKLQPPEQDTSPPLPSPCVPAVVVAFVACGVLGGIAARPERWRVHPVNSVIRAQHMVEFVHRCLAEG